MMTIQEIEFVHEVLRILDKQNEDKRLGAINTRGAIEFFQTTTQDGQVDLIGTIASDGESWFFCPPGDEELESFSTVINKAEDR